MLTRRENDGCRMDFCSIKPKYILPGFSERPLSHFPGSAVFPRVCHFYNGRLLISVDWIDE